MKKIQLNDEGWKERFPIILSTQEEEILQMDKETVDKDERLKTQLTDAIDKIKSFRQPAEQTDIDKATIVYNKYKPTLAVGDEYQLISFDCNLSDTIAKGILNCRVNGDHKQIRFTEEL
jgi:hypothetical protein